MKYVAMIGDGEIGVGTTHPGAVTRALGGCWTDMVFAPTGEVFVYRVNQDLSVYCERQYRVERSGDEYRVTEVQGRDGAETIRRVIEFAHSKDVHERARQELEYVVPTL